MKTHVVKSNINQNRGLVDPFLGKIFQEMDQRLTCQSTMDAKSSKISMQTNKTCYFFEKIKTAALLKKLLKNKVKTTPEDSKILLPS